MAGSRTNLGRLAASAAPLVVVAANLGSCGDEDGKPRERDAGNAPGGEGGLDGNGGTTPRGGTAGTDRGGANGDGGDGASDPGGAGFGGEATGGAPGSSGRGGSPGNGGTGGRGGTGADSGAGGEGGESCTTVDVPLDNADFDETGDAWVSYGTTRPLIVSGESEGITPESEPNVVRLGGVNDELAGLYQTITLPEGAVWLTLTGYRRVQTEEQSDDPFDVAGISLWEDAESGTALIGELVSFGNDVPTTDWVHFTGTVNVEAYGGEDVDLDIWAETDFALVTEFYVDSLAMQMVVCR